MKNGKRILEVRVKSTDDTSPDTSHYGEYSNTRTSEFSIDRTHDLDCLSQEYNHPTNEGAEHLQNAIEYLKGEMPNATGRVFSANMDARALLESLHDAECNCGERGDRERNEFRYFNPSFNYVDKFGNALPENTHEEVCRYVQQDYARMESFAYSWFYIGMWAEADIQITNGGPIQKIESSGLWGIESDSDLTYIADVQKEELSELRSQLQALGFSNRAVSKAFQTIKFER